MSKWPIRVMRRGCKICPKGPFARCVFPSRHTRTPPILASAIRSQSPTAAPPSPPRQFPTSGFEKLNHDEKIEEEDTPLYEAQDFYPVHIGEVFESRYQVVTKLGFGVSSTVWLCRDLREHRYLTLKVCVRSKQRNHHTSRSDHEISVSKHLSNFETDHPGKNLLRVVLDSFDVCGPNGDHRCLLYQPLGMSYTDFLKLTPQNMITKELLQKTLQLLFLTLDHLHGCGVVHTDISTNNLLFGVQDLSFLSQVEEDEFDRPSSRKVLEDRVVYRSRALPITSGLPVLCDLGEARIGDQKHEGDIMPGVYRAPEVIFGMKWDHKVDIWSMGVMIWDLFEGGRLFFAKKNGLLDDEQHLAEMASLLGPPPSEFLKQSEKCLRFWDDKGTWKGTIDIPDQSFEVRERRLSGEDRDLLLGLVRRMLRWLPDERPTARELAYDDFLMKPILNSKAAS